MAVFADYVDLRRAVLETVGRTDITDVFPRLVLMAEARFNREFRTRHQMTEATVTISSGTASLPSGFLEALGLFDSNGYEYIAQPIQNAQTASHKQFYAISGSTITTTGADGDKTLIYYTEIPTLTDGGDSDSNWLLANYPGVYLYGVAAEAAKYLRDVEQAQVFAALTGDEMRQVFTDDERTRYSRARVRVAGVTP